MSKPDHRAAVMLAAVTLLWGVSFPLVKEWQTAANCPAGLIVASGTLIALRMVAGLVLLLVTQPRLFTQPTRGEWRDGLAIGALFFAGFACQTLGLVYTSPARSGFITSLSSLWVPILVWLTAGTRPGWTTVTGMSCALGGVAVLSGPELLSGGITAGRGELLTLACTLFFAWQILAIDRYGQRGRPVYFTVGTLLVPAVGGVSLAALTAWTLGQYQAWLAWLPSQLLDGGQLLRLLFLASLCTALAFVWLNKYQPRISANRAALIYLLEAVFAALASVIWGLDRFDVLLAIGGVLVLGGNLLAELAPRPPSTTA